MEAEPQAGSRPERRSGLETWSQVMREAPRRNLVEGRLPLILSAAGALGVLPFAILRLHDGQLVAGLIDMVVVVGFVLVGTFVYRTKKVRTASIVGSGLCAVGVITTVYLYGPQQAYWAYPALMSIFYLLRPREAIALAFVVIAALLPTLLTFDDSFRMTTVVVTIIVTCAFAYAFVTITNKQRDELIRLATRDPLTGAGNRRALETRLTEIVALHRRRAGNVSLLLIDLDHFKKVNDKHGHAVGDHILQSITQIINLRIRTTDGLYRIGGEEFVVVADDLDLQQATHLAEQLRLLVDANELVPDHSVTISLGVAQLKLGESPTDWLLRADSALYDAKRNGRNVTRAAA